MNIQIITAMSEIRFNLTPIDEKPSRRYRKGSKLNKRIEAKRLEGIKVSVVNNVCYLEKT
jgi:hypothetical protein